MTEASVRRHKAAHLPDRLLLAQDAVERLEAGSLLDRLLAVRSETVAVLQEAKRARDPELRLKALTRLEKQIHLEGVLIGEIRPGGGEVNVAVGVAVGSESFERAVQAAAAEFVASALADNPALREQVADHLTTRRKARLDAAMAAVTTERARLFEPPSP